MGYLQPSNKVIEAVRKVAAVDRGAAEELVRLGLYEALSDQIDQARPALENAALTVIEKRTTAARIALLRNHVGKALEGHEDADDLELARALGELTEYVDVSKASLLGSMLSIFNEKHPRDEGGRFVRTEVGPAKDKDLGPKKHNAAAMSVARGQIGAWSRDGALDSDRRVQAIFRRADGKGGEKRVSVEADKLEELVSQYADGDKPLVLQAISHNARAGLKGKTDATQREAAFDAMNHFTGPELAGRVSRNMKTRLSPEEGDELAANWNNGDAGTDRRAYRRMAMTGAALASVSGANTPGATVGGLAQLMGDLGPEAEKIIAPGIQRIAYRYRGTERRPDADIMSSVSDAGRGLDMAFPEINPDWSEDQKRSVSAQAEKFRERFRDRFAAMKGRPETAEAIVGYYAQDAIHGRYSPDQLEMRVLGDTTAAHLASQIVDPKLTELNRTSGQTPPSQGVMIDAQGRVITQAVGFNGDHYLPFDLKNLKSMQGGQYVRTRADGGPTSEDIYTGLMTGARQIQVISNSGVFTVEFDPDMRGGRRYSDKAAKMVERYEHLLDTIGSGSKLGLMQQDLPGKVKADLYNQAMEQMNWDPEEGPKLYQDLLAAARLKSQSGVEEGFSGTESIDEKLEAQAEDEAKEYSSRMGDRITTGQRGRWKEDRLRELQDEARAEQAKPYRLDGDGYAAALAALQAEFPYYIRSVEKQTLREFHTSRKLGPSPRSDSRANDRSYVPPGANKPGLHEGFYGEAAQANRGRYKARSAQQAAAAPSESDATPGSGGSLTSTGPRPGSTQAAPAAANFPIRFAIDKETKPLNELVGPTSPAARKMTALSTTVVKPIERLGGTVLTLTYPEGMTEDQILETATATSYVGWKWNQFPTADRPAQFTKWLMGSATPDQRTKVMDGLSQLEEVWDAGAEGGVATLYATAGGQDAYKSKLEEFLTLAELASPFADPEPDMDLARPASGSHPKPQPYPWVLALGNKLENYDRFEESAAKQGHPLGVVIPGARVQSDEAMRDHITRMLDKLEEMKKQPTQKPGDLQTLRKQIANNQQSWAFSHARHMAELAGEHAPDPKAWGAPAPSPGQETKPVEKAASTGRLVPLFPAGRPEPHQHPVAKALRIRLEPRSLARR